MGVFRLRRTGLSAPSPHSAMLRSRLSTAIPNANCSFVLNRNWPEFIGFSELINKSTRHAELVSASHYYIVSMFFPVYELPK